MELAFTSWEYTPGTDLVAPLHSIERWIDQGIADASMSWLDCMMLDTRRPMFRTQSSLAAEAFSPRREDRMAWLRRALTGGTKLLLLRGHRPGPFMHAFTKMDELPAGVAQLRELPWCIPESAISGLSHRSIAPAATPSSGMTRRSSSPHGPRVSRKRRRT